MKLANASLLALLTILAGCSMVEKQYVTDQPITRADGTVIPAGTPIYVDKDGEPTPDAKAADGTDNAPLMEPDVDKIEALTKTAKSAGDSIPWGGGIIGAIIGAAGGALVTTAANKRKKLRESTNDKLAGKKKV